MRWTDAWTLGSHPARWTALIVAAVSVAAPNLAVAATAGAGPFGGLTYEAGVGEENRLDVAIDDGGVTTFTDYGAVIVAGRACSPSGPNSVTCQPVFNNSCGGEAPCTEMGPSSIELGDRDDTLSISGVASSTRGGPSIISVHGGDGNDRLSGGEGPEFFDGGPNADYMKGNGGIDITTYLSRAEGVRVTLDETANDGAPGENDDVRTENVLGSGAPDVLIGNQYDNGLSGHTGADRIESRGGNDNVSAEAGATVLAGPGDDRVSFRTDDDGTRDHDPSSQVHSCGPGKDQVSGVEPTRARFDCESVTTEPEPYFDLPMNVERCRAGNVRVSVTQDTYGRLTVPTRVAIYTPSGTRLARTRARMIRPNGTRRFVVPCPARRRFTVAAETDLEYAGGGVRQVRRLAVERQRLPTSSGSFRTPTRR